MGAVGVVCFCFFAARVCVSTMGGKGRDGGCVLSHVRWRCGGSMMVSMDGRAIDMVDMDVLVTRKHR